MQSQHRHVESKMSNFGRFGVSLDGLDVCAFVRACVGGGGGGSLLYVHACMHSVASKF